jgi:hypothetical protein
MQFPGGYRPVVICDLIIMTAQMILALANIFLLWLQSRLFTDYLGIDSVILKNLNVLCEVCGYLWSLALGLDHCKLTWLDCQYE